MSEDIITEVKDFTHKPDGLIARFHESQARHAALVQERVNADERIEAPAFKAVKTAQQSPEAFSANTYTIPAGGAAPILPLAPYRFRAVVSCITSSSYVILAKDQGAAISGNGFPQVFGLPSLELRTRAQVWAYNPGSSTVQVAVIAESYGPEK